MGKRQLTKITLLAIAVAATTACSSSHDSATGSSSADSGTAGAAQLSPDCQRLYNCCVGPAAAQTSQFCKGLVAGGACDVWLQSYAQAGIQCM